MPEAPIWQPLALSVSGLATFQNQFCGMTRFTPLSLKHFVILLLRFVKLLPDLPCGVFCQEVYRDLLTIIDIEPRIQILNFLLMDSIGLTSLRSTQLVWEIPVRTLSLPN